jgi:ABC transporter substrate binding protein
MEFWLVLSRVESWISAEISLFSVHGVCHRTRRRALSQLDSEYFRAAQRTRHSLRDTLIARRTNRTGRAITASEHMRRREFITLLGGAAAWPVVARAQQPTSSRLVGLLLAQSEGSQEARDRVAAIREGLEKLDWIEGHNLRFETRYANGSADRMCEEAAQLVQLRPDVLIASATSALATLKKATSTIPIVFAWPGTKSAVQILSNGENWNRSSTTRASLCSIVDLSIRQEHLQR